MAASSQFQSAKTVGLRRTVRFQMRDVKEVLVQRGYIVRGVLMQQLGFHVEDIFCVQQNNMERSFDVTMTLDLGYRKLLEKCEQNKDAGLLSKLKVSGLDRPGFRIVTVHMYNPHVSTPMIVAFLKQYGDVLSEARLLKDDWGVWNGKRQFHMVLSPSPGGMDGVKHPPASFFIGPDRGYLIYSRQPPFCRSCWSAGHVEGVCPGRRCRLCGEAGHEAKDCSAPRKCHICGEPGHLARSCPGQSATFAQVVARQPVNTMAVPPKPAVEEGVERMEEEEVSAQSGPAEVEVGGESAELFSVPDEERCEGEKSSKKARLLSSPEEGGLEKKKVKTMDGESESEENSLEMDSFATEFMGGAPVTPVHDWSEMMSLLGDIEPSTSSEDGEPSEPWKTQRDRRKKRKGKKNNEQPQGPPPTEDGPMTEEASAQAKV